MESGEEINTQTWHIRNEYRKQVKKFISYYKKECRENRIDYVFMDTKNEFDQALFKYLIKRKKMR